MREKQVKCVRVGEGGDWKVVTACDIDSCWEPATQFHGPSDHIIYTCDAHAEEVMMQLLGVILEVPPEDEAV